MFSGDPAVVGCISGGQEEEYRALVSDFVEWPGKNHLLLNAAKAREMVIDFRKRKRTATQPLNIEVVEDQHRGCVREGG